jgi:hypothetical protein
VTRRLPLLALWIAAGYGVAAGLFWGLLQVPESSAWMLGLSACLVLAILVALLWVTGGLLLAWHPQITPMCAFISGLSASLAVAAGALFFGAIWWATHAALTWHGAHAGEIDAVIMARSGASNTAWLHRTIVWTIWILRWGPGFTLALSLAAWIAARGTAAIGAAGWIRAGVHPKRWTLILALAALCFMLPWRFVYWRPAHLSVTTEPWFVGAKLGAMALLAAIAWALMIRVVTPLNNRLNGNM